MINHDIIDSIIYMYEGKKEITCDAYLIFDSGVTAKGIATLKEHKGFIEFKGDLKDINGFIPNDDKTNVLEIKADSVIPYCKCKLYNFPKEGRDLKLENKNLIIEFFKTKVDSQFTLHFLQKSNDLELELTPLIANDNGEIGKYTIM